ncbi:HTH_Tnp_Tc3_2 domain-containing protein [Trichonephila clavipes]|nr:HTH_Tnp_Tc3_2 domain-containing protein [Trichonephila clavipes]
MQEGKTDQRGRSHPPQCTTSRKDRQIERMTVTDRSVISRNIAKHIESVTHHSVSARTIRHRLKQSGLSARRPLLGLPLTQNYRRLHRKCSLDLSPIENMRSMVAQRFTQFTLPTGTPDQLGQCVVAAWSAVHQDHIQSLFESMPRRLTSVISINGGYTSY